MPKKKTKKLSSIFKTETVHSVDYDDFSAFVNKFYGIEGYEFAMTQECGNDSSHTFNPDGKMDAQQIEKFIKEDGAVGYVNEDIFNDLVAKGEIPAGNYCVNVCW